MVTVHSHLWIKQDWIENWLWGCVQMIWVIAGWVHRRLYSCWAEDVLQRQTKVKNRRRLMEEEHRRVQLPAVWRHSSLLWEKQKTLSKARCSAAERKAEESVFVTPGGETFIDKPKSFTAHYSSDNLETAAGGIDRGDGQTPAKQGVKNRGGFSETLNLNPQLFHRARQLF